MTGGGLLIVADTLDGGLGAVVADQARWFAARGWSVTLAAPGGPVDLPVPGSIRRIGASVRAARRLRRIVADTHPAIVHVHGLRSTAIATVAGIRRPFVTVHGIAAAPSDPPLHHLARRLGRALVPRLAAVAASAEPGYGSRWTYTPFASPRLRELDGLPFPAAGTVPTFVWLGLLDERKQPDAFVRAIADVAASGQPIRGVVAGDGPRTAEIAHLAHVIGAPVDMVGHVDPATAIRDGWAVVLLSRSEGTPLAIEEAMWAGRAVVASRLPGIEHLAGHTGRLVDDPADVAPALVALCDHQTARAAGAAAATRIRAVIAPDDPWPAVEKLYRR